MKILSTLSLMFLFTANSAFSQTYNPQKKTTETANNAKPNSASPAVNTTTGNISSSNRRNFYTGLLFTRTYLDANTVGTTGNKDGANLKSFFDQSQGIYTILKGNKEQKSVPEAFQKLKTSNNFDDFAKSINSIKMSYLSGLTSEEKWFFDLGTIVGEMEYGIKTRNNYSFIQTDSEFETLLQKIPKGSSSALTSSIKITADLAKSERFDDDDLDQPFIDLDNQIQKNLDIIGKLSNDDAKK